MSGCFDLHSLPVKFMGSIFPIRMSVAFAFGVNACHPRLMNDERLNQIFFICCATLLADAYVVAIEFIPFTAFSSQWQNLMASVDEILSGMRSLSTVFSDFCNQPVMIYTQSNLLRIQQGLADLQRLVTNMQKYRTAQFTSMWSRS